ncbi:E3 ubiquitin-protein ligase RNF217 [Pyrus ussuriensis x Pyrus communis]|uniref:E3 ubiquitin-protein ligase RNF217 n=1 Tax=Pyrus ussuriensis x Pyrus communis TaxID=2448454 RepID=A0A5N5GWI8_9ROSA|nr:E3 ubiquitin-protein ligase RNF217 [Pyrus ussuriensis x Pyrus communis]
MSSVKNKKLEHAVDIGDDPSFVCDLCEAKIHLGYCAHFYCQECAVQYVVSNLQNNVTSTIMCPVQGCAGVLDPNYCRPILPDDVFDGWGNALCESALVDESDDIDSTFVCADLLSVTAVEFKLSNIPVIVKAELGKKGEDKMLEELAKKRWRRCPNCNYYVEIISGCNYIKCSVDIGSVTKVECNVQVTVLVSTNVG